MAAIACASPESPGRELLEAFEAIVSHCAAVRGYGPLPGLEPERRRRLDELALGALEAWIDARRLCGSLDPATPFQRALARYHDLLMRV